MASTFDGAHAKQASVVAIARWTNAGRLRKGMPHGFHIKYMPSCCVTGWLAGVALRGWLAGWCCVTGWLAGWLALRCVAG